MVAIVAAQEFQWVLSAAKKTGSTVGVWFEWHKAERRVGIYYFYVLDPDVGPGFIKICTYVPYPAKVWLNGHEWPTRWFSRHRPPALRPCAARVSSRPSLPSLPRDG